MKEDLDKMDANVAEMYAAKCKRDPKDLLALMKKGGWLTAKEALEWGFVDEITDYEDDAAPVITDLVAADMSAAGIPIPSGFSKEPPSSNAMSRFFEAFTNFFKSNQNNNNPTDQMNPETPTTQQPQATQTPQAPHAEQPAETVTAEAHASAIAEKDAEIARLNAEIAALKKAPGDVTSHIVDDQKNGGEHNEEKNPAVAFAETRQRAKALYDILPH